MFNPMDWINQYDYRHPTPVADPVEHAYAYQNMEHILFSTVRGSYESLAWELTEQFENLVRGGMVFEFVEGEPHANSGEMHHDVLNNQHLSVRKTVGSTYNDLTTENHPMGQLVEPYANVEGFHGIDLPIMLNDVFRAVHDVVGHTATRSGFGPDGENVAWLHHRQTLGRMTHLALWCETRGQNAWTNFYGDNNLLPLKDRPFAAQKCGIVDPKLI